MGMVLHFFVFMMFVLPVMYNVHATVIECIMLWS